MWEIPFRAIFKDGDRSLVNVEGPDKVEHNIGNMNDYGWVTPYSVHLDIPSISYGRPDMLIDPTDETKTLALPTGADEIHYW